MGQKEINEVSKMLNVKTLEIQNMESRLIEDPELSKEKIAQIIIGLADGEVGNLANKMLELLADNKRLNLIEAINTSYPDR